MNPKRSCKSTSTTAKLLLPYLFSNYFKWKWLEQLSTKHVMRNYSYFVFNSTCAIAWWLTKRDVKCTFRFENHHGGSSWLGTALECKYRDNKCLKTPASSSARLHSVVAVWDFQSRISGVSPQLCFTPIKDIFNRWLTREVHLHIQHWTYCATNEIDSSGNQTIDGSHHLCAFKNEHCIRER